MKTVDEMHNENITRMATHELSDAKQFSAIKKRMTRLEIAAYVILASSLGINIRMPNAKELQSKIPPKMETVASATIPVAK